MLNKNLFTLLSCLLLTGCGMIDYHPYDVRISGETDVNAHNIEQIEADCKGKVKRQSALSLWATHNGGTMKRRIS